MTRTNTRSSQLRENTTYKKFKPQVKKCFGMEIFHGITQQNFIMN